MTIQAGRWTGVLTPAKFYGFGKWDWGWVQWLTDKGLHRRKTLWEYTADPKDPLTFIDVDDVMYRPDNHMIHDFGSVPSALDALVGRDEFMRSFILHDSGYEDHGLYVSRDGGKTWKFEELPRDKVDYLLASGVLAEDAPRVTMVAVYTVVRRFGESVWDDRTSDSPDKQRRQENEKKDR